jgi:hypothetical protein
MIKRPSDYFLGDATQVDSDEVASAFDMILEAIDTYGDITTAQLRQICQEKHPAVWVRAIHVLFHGSESRIVPDKVAKNLFSSFGKIQRHNAGDQVALALGSDLDKLRLISLEALGELCALIRDTSSNPTAVAVYLGHAVFLGDGNASPSDRKVASMLMQTMVQHAEILFGKPATRSQFDPLGVRPVKYLQKVVVVDKKVEDPKDTLEALGFM